MQIEAKQTRQLFTKLHATTFPCHFSSSKIDGRGRNLITKSEMENKLFPRHGESENLIYCDYWEVVA
jgi:hypothetical protein